ncbi:MAG: NAD(P)H-dependent oxidoreductase subunit E, partial [Candidatus Cloacimonetes bacterium]|nr:NAD(P)H-dependent oxidoreductase subunit E [Candidatus Cloacimonadota bacterium]
MEKQVIDLNREKELYKAATARIDRRIIVCAGTGCIANGSMKVFDALKREIEAKGLDVVVELDFEDNKDHDVHLTKSGCQGFCQVGPLVTILPDDIMYNKVSVNDVKEIVKTTLIENSIVDRLLYKEPKSGNLYKGIHEIPFYTQQKRTVIAKCGVIDPEDIREYINLGGYSAARKVFTQSEPEDVCKLIKDSGMRGRGGGGFSTGFKWELTLAQKNEKKYVICNGDEGDPGAFMDRSILEGNPHSIVEGMMIAARAIEANEGYIYVRVEYPLAVRRI